MGEGWETARRRDAGNDWVEVALACEGVVTLAELDTSYFLGNAPGSASLTGIGPDGEVPLLPRTRLQPDTRHRFVLDGRRRRGPGAAGRLPGRRHGPAPAVGRPAGRAARTGPALVRRAAAGAGNRGSEAEGVPLGVAEETVAARPLGRADGLQTMRTSVGL